MGMTRRAIREHIFKLLFDLDFYGNEEAGTQVELYFQQVPDEEIENLPMFAEEEDREYIARKVSAVAEKIPEIDGAINAVARGWRTGRMAKADLAILRLAVYEIRYDDDIPAGVAINEAVELSKIYGNDASPAFINGILAKMV